MEPKDVFGIIIRTIGLVLIIMWVFTLINGIALKSGLLLTYSFAMCTIGGYLLQGCPFIVRFSYPKKENGVDQE